MGKQKINKTYNLKEIIIKSVIVIGVLLVFYQFFINRSLWRDEAKLALNIINKSPAELLKPLDYLQVGPILFLQIEKYFSRLVPNSEYGLRLFPLIAYLVSLGFFYKIIRHLHKNYYTIVLALSLFVFNATLIYYSSEVKQYMADVLVLTAIYYILIRKYKNENYKYFILGAVGSVGVFLSNVAPIVLLTAGLYLFYENFKAKKKQLPVMVISFVWIVTFLIYFFGFIHNHPLRSGMLKFWSLNNGFLPTNPFSYEFYEFLVFKVNMILKMNGSTAMLPIFHRAQDSFIALDFFLLIFVLVGFFQLFKKRKINILILLVTPIAIHLLLSGLKIYPFDTRMLLYTCPLIIIISSFGFQAIAKVAFIKFKKEKFALLAVVMPLFMGCLLYIESGFPIENVELKKSLSYLNENIKQEDKVFLSRAVQPAYQYYEQTSFISINASRLVFEKNVSTHSVGFLNELGNLSGRVWFIFDSDFQYPISYFNTIGLNPIEFYEAHGSSIYLYDL